MRTARLLAIVAANAAMQMAAVVAARLTEIELNYVKRERERRRAARPPAEEKVPGWLSELWQVRDETN